MGFATAVSRLEATAMQAMISRGRVTRLVQWSEALPEEAALARPRLRMYQGWAWFLNGQCPRGKPMLEQARVALEELLTLLPEYELAEEPSWQRSAWARAHEGVRIQFEPSDRLEAA